MSTPAIPASHVLLKRAYVAAESSDGVRILVDRLWPRGVSKQKAALDDWMKDLAPSTELRQWFHHEPARWSEFEARYRVELRQHGPALAQLRALAKTRVVTLVYGARDQAQNQAVVLREVLLHGDKGEGDD
ncbi:DUF488 domain-containing protein [Thermomonas sp. HDW16]|uniref:DUF488 domain-containing protein n=1 Tax=Thermomonas sp. HDW16 TaxID=2714945 RepID=UPI001407BD13|nr:DUF488 domain-containing protein [Thermomonas sp. HDW16]QIL21607.1 DUF488 domain-containing protein [Thermomonas sp. HDW16]